ncbi:kinesin-like protein KIF26B isoform X2 [Littorina saxatilis]|uniref:kinesin-like protein KIF26B isoform X2 n=1 Tax=Littorina saxatilis TaxID=31220 RepID=UPI0038B4AF25
MLRVTASPGAQGDASSRFLTIDPHRKQITVFDPSASGYVTSANRRTGIAAPKMFAFDAVFTPDDSLTELCAASLSEIVQAVVSGADGCLFTYGYSKTGKSHTMLGGDQSALTLGVMPCAIAWLFKLINEQKDKTGARFSVRVSAVEVTGKSENLKDLLADIAQGTEATGVGTAPGVYLREDPICGTQLENQSELRAPTAEKAALYLDAALAARSAMDEDEARSSHLLFTLNVYQYRIEKANRAGLPGVAGGRSRLHLIDLGSASKSRDPNNVSLSLSALGNVIMALLNGQRHVPHRDSKISQLLRDSLGNVTCRTCMLAHVSSALPHYNETLQVIQLAARIHRMKRRRTKFSSTSSEDSSTDESIKFRRPYRGLRMGTLREDVLYSSSLSDPDYTSSSEQSCDTVIYMGANGQSLSDRELTDNEGPPRHVPRTNPRLPRRPSGSRSSGDDSDSGRSRASEGRCAPRPAMGVRAGSSGGSPGAGARGMQPVPHVMSAPGSPSHVKMAHRITTHGKGPASGKPSGEGSGHWPEKVSKHRVKAVDKAGEQWVDGPGAAIYPESKKSGEQWVDGPSAFLVQNEPPPPPPPQATAPATTSTPQSPSHRGDTARRMKNRKVEAEELWVDGPREMMTASQGGTGGTATPLHTSSKTEPVGRTVVGQPNQSGKLSMAVNEKALKQALIKHLEKERPDSTTSADTNTSTMPEAPDSRPASSMLEGGAKGEPSSSPSLRCKAPEWDRRQAGDGVSQVDVQQLEDPDNVHDSSSTPPSPYRKHHREHLAKKLHGSLASPKHSPKASPACSRKVGGEAAKPTARLLKSDLPGSASPTHRVAQWIKSVSKSDAPVCGAAAVQVTSDVQALVDVTMADAGTNTEHDSDFERMADSEGSPPPLSAEGGADTCNNNTANLVDTSFDSSVDTTSRDSETRPDSLYEHTVEEQLENLASRKDSSMLAKDYDDETFSSLSAREAEDTDREDSVLVQHSKVLTEGRQSAKLAKHLAAHEGSPRLDLDPAAFLHDLSKPLLSRKPDGASNPNLHREFSEEECVVGEQCVGAHYAVCQDTEVYAATATQALYSSKDGLGSETPSPNLSAKGSKLAIRSKPPLPQKPSSSSNAASPKISGLAKPSAVSSSCSSSGPSAGSSATSTPKSISSKDSPLLTAKQTSPKSSALPVLTNGHGARKDKDKNGKNGSKDKTSASCSSLTSSPSGKNGNKSGNGNGSSKLPLFSSKSPVLGSSSPSPVKDSKLRKKEKENGKVTRTINGKYVELAAQHHHKTRSGNNDSDSGNDSGIVAHEKKLLSPYATVTKPRTPSHSSSGHGSDNSSTISTEVHSQPSSKGDKLHGGTSSGYESMLRESEGTASSDDHEDSGSENSGEKKKGSKRKGTKRSRSAPARSSESPSSNGGSQGSRAWQESRHKSKDEPLELKKYDVDDVERLQRRRQDEPECRNGDRVREKSKDVETKQPLVEEGSKPEIIDSKDRISLDQRGWGFDCKFLMCFCKSRNSRGTDV